MVSGKRRSSPFLKKVSDAIRVRHYSIRTEHTYIDWIKRFILFHDKRHPDKMGGDEVAEFLGSDPTRRSQHSKSGTQCPEFSL